MAQDKGRLLRPLLMQLKVPAKDMTLSLLPRNGEWINCAGESESFSGVDMAANWFDVGDVRLTPCACRVKCLHEARL